MASKIEPLLTIEDLEAMPDDGNRYELIEGEIYASRAPSLTHQRIIRNLMEGFFIYLAQNPIGEILPGPGVIFSEFSGVIPDLVFISNKRRDEIASADRLTGAPDLIIEVVSPGTENERRDRNVKRRLYGRHGVEEYWVVDPERRTVEIYRQRQRGLRLVETLSIRDEITSPILPEFRCKI